MRFDGTDDGLYGEWGLSIAKNYPVFVHALVDFTSTNDGWVAGLTSDGGNNQTVLIEELFDGLRFISNDDRAEIFSVTPGQWDSVGGVARSATSRYAILNGVYSSEDTSSQTFGADMDRVVIGARLRATTPADYIIADIAEVCIYNVEPPDPVKLRLMRGECPLDYPDGLAFYAPLRGDTIDLVSGRRLTVAGNPTWAPHPPMVRRRPFPMSAVRAPVAAGSQDFPFRHYYMGVG